MVAAQSRAESVRLPGTAGVPNPANVADRAEGREGCRGPGVPGGAAGSEPTRRVEPGAGRLRAVAEGSKLKGPPRGLKTEAPRM